MDLHSRSPTTPADVREARPANGDRVRVLLVEDNDDDVLVTRRALADSALFDAEVVRVVRLGDAGHLPPDRRPDVVLLDLTLPDSAGLDTVALARRLLDPAPIVVLTGMHDEALGVEALWHGADDFLRKGTADMGRLDRTIRYAMARRGFRARDAERALYDERTGLPGRAIFADRLGTAIRRAERNETLVAVARIHCTALPSLVDTHGQLAADIFERALLKRLGDTLHLADSLAVLGPGQYACIIESLVDVAQVDGVTRLLGRGFSAPVQLPTLRRGMVRVEPGPVRIGVATWPADGSTAGALLAAAAAVMQSKGQPDGQSSGE